MKNQSKVSLSFVATIIVLMACAPASEPEDMAANFLSSIGVEPAPMAQRSVTQEEGLVVLKQPGHIVKVDPVDGRVCWYRNMELIGERRGLAEYARNVADWDEASAYSHLRAIARLSGALDGWEVAETEFHLDVPDEHGRFLRGVASMTLSESMGGLHVKNGGNGMHLEADPHTGSLIRLSARYGTKYEGSASLSESEVKDRALAALMQDMSGARIDTVPAVVSIGKCYSPRYAERPQFSDELNVAIKPQVARLAYEVVFEAVPDPTHREIMRNIKLYVDAQNGEILWRRYNILAKSHE